MASRILVVGQVVLASGQDGGAPVTATLGYGDQTPPGQGVRRRLEDEVCPSAVWTPLTDPAQNLDLAFVQRIPQCHAISASDSDETRSASAPGLY